LTEGEKMLLTPTYHVMKMYQVHQDAQLVPLDFTSPMYSFEGKSIPAISASASKDAAGVLHISLTNVDPTQTHTLQFSLRGENWKNIRAEIVTSPKVNDYNTFEEPNKITVQPFKKVRLQENKISTEIPPHSVMMLTINPS
ncbi:MAG: alpha-L-arabinofuranosidase C-terminal domain-containing protein, partial [Spirosomataceae bacterium]